MILETSADFHSRAPKPETSEAELVPLLRDAAEFVALQLQRGHSVLVHSQDGCSRAGAVPLLDARYVRYIFFRHPKFEFSAFGV